MYTLANSTYDVTNDIDFMDGSTVEMTKRLDGIWAAGTGEGGRCSTASISNGTYHCYSVEKAGGADLDFYFHPSANSATVLTDLQAETGGASYVTVTRLGAILRELDAIVLFKQDGNLFMRAPAAQSAIGPGSSAQTVTLKVPTGVRVLASVGVALHFGASSAASYCLSVSDLALPDTLPSNYDCNLVMQTLSTSGTYRASSDASVMTNESAQIRVRLSSADANLVQNVITRGWVDNIC